MQINGTIDDNFWILNPELKIPQAFNELYSSDKSKDKEDSSKLLWGVFLLIDTDSKFANLPESDRKELIEKDYFKVNKFDWKTLKSQVKLYETLLLTPAKRALKVWNDKMDERSDFLKSTKYDIGTPNDRGQLVGGTAEIIDKMMSNTKKLFDDYQRVIKDLEEEKTREKSKGNRKTSLTDSGQI